MAADSDPNAATGRTWVSMGETTVATTICMDQITT